MHSMGGNSDNRIVLTAEQIQKRVRELGRNITDDYGRQLIHVVCVLEDSFVFAADLVRELDTEAVCSFVRSDVRDVSHDNSTTREIFFSPEADVRGAHVLLVEALLNSGVTADFLLRNLQGRGAASVKLVTLLDRPSARRVPLQADYFGFLIDEPYVYGYGLGKQQKGRNLPCLVATAEVAAFSELPLG